MGTAIVKQPDGRYAVFSTVVDSWLVYDADRQEVIDYFAERARDDSVRNTVQALQLVEEFGTSVPRNREGSFEYLDAIASEHGGSLEDCRKEQEQ